MIDRLLCVLLGILMFIELGMKKVVSKAMWAEVEKRVASKRRMS